MWAPISWADADRAAGPVVGQLGQTGLLGLARYGRRRGNTEPGLRTCPPRLEANPQAGGTVRPNTSMSWPAGALRRRVTCANRSVWVWGKLGQLRQVPRTAAQVTASKSGKGNPRYSSFCHSSMGGVWPGRGRPEEGAPWPGCDLGQAWALYLELKFLKTRFLKTGRHHFGLPPLHGNTREAKSPVSECVYQPLWSQHFSKAVKMGKKDQKDPKNVPDVHGAHV